jgi:tetratricopeptide (TPR) repeat protein
MMIRALTPPLALNYRRPFRGIAFTALFLLASIHAQVTPAPAAHPTERLESLRHQVEAAEQQGLPPAKTGYLWAVLANAYQGDARMEQAEEAYNRALPLLAKDPAAQANYATALENLGSLYLELGRVKQAAAVREKAFALRQGTGKPLEIAISRQRLAEAELAQHHFKDAAREALAAYTVLTPEPGQLRTRLSALVTLSYAQCMMRQCAEGLTHARLALQIVQSSFTPDSVELGHVSMALGFAQWKSGSPVEAEQSIAEGLRLLRLRLGDKSPLLMAGLYEYREYLKAMHRSPEIVAVDRQIAAMRPPIIEAACKDCVSVFGLR